MPKSKKGSAVERAEMEGHTETDRQLGNAFEALCALAAREKWCWKVLCSTCGHHYFRYAFRELAQGGHPGSASWKTKKDNHDQLEQFLGPAPPITKWPLQEQELLIPILSEVSLERLASLVDHPDWLGYLGLALFHTEQAEQRDRALTIAWGQQLLQQMHPEAPSRAVLEEIIKSSFRVLRWSDLGQMEHHVVTARKDP